MAHEGEILRDSLDLLAIPNAAAHQSRRMAPNPPLLPDQTPESVRKKVEAHVRAILARFGAAPRETSR